MKCFVQTNSNYQSYQNASHHNKYYNGDMNVARFTNGNSYDNGYDKESFSGNGVDLYNNNNRRTYYQEADQHHQRHLSKVEESNDVYVNHQYNNNNNNNSHQQHHHHHVNKQQQQQPQHSHNSNDLNRYRDLVEKMDRLYPNVKWPLHQTWSFWYIKNDRLKKDWKDNLIKLIDISYVEDFWSMFRHLIQPSGLETGADLALFKSGIEPMWEDVQNKNGGRWLLTFSAQSRKSNDLDEIWLNSILALIGDNFCGNNDNNATAAGAAGDHATGDDNDDHICEGINGICVQNRPKIDKLSLWTKDYENERITRLIGKRWKENVDLQRMSISFEPHDSQHSKASNSKFLYKE